MTNTDDLDTFFAMLVDHDVDFADGNEAKDVPVLTYRWCRNKDVSDCAVQTLVEAGEKSMKELGLKRIVCQGHHLRKRLTKQGSRPNSYSFSSRTTPIKVMRGTDCPV